MAPANLSARLITPGGGPCRDERSHLTGKPWASAGPARTPRAPVRQSGPHRPDRPHRATGVPFEVIGVTKPKGVDTNGLDQDDISIVPLGAALRRLMNVVHVQTIHVQAKRSHRLEDRRDDFTIQNQATLIEGESETAQSMTLLVGSVAGISLLVGGVGILAVMLISVRAAALEPMEALRAE